MRSLRPHLPIRAIYGCVSFGIDGSAWATFNAPGMSTKYQKTKRRLEIHRRVASALMLIAGTGARSEFTIQGVTTPADPAAALDAMLGDVDLATHPNWVRWVELSLASLQGDSSPSRDVFLSVKLAEPSGWKLLKSVGRSVEDLIGADLGLGARPVRGSEAKARLAEAKALADRLTNILGQEVSPVSATTLEWLYQRTYLRGIDDLPPDRRNGKAVTAGRLMTIADRTKIFEGGHRDDPGRNGGRYVKVVNETPAGGRRVAYQAVALVSTHPGQWEHPDGDGEWLSRIDLLAGDLDWCERVRVVDPETAQARIRRKRHNVVSQLTERADTSANKVLQSVQDLDENAARLADNPGEWDLQVTTMFVGAAPTLEELETDLTEVGDYFTADGYTIDIPVGHQCDLLAAMQPGSAPHYALRHFGQVMMCADLATAGPFETARFGDPGGNLVGDQWDGEEKRGPVYFDLSYGPRKRNRGSSMCFLGEQGAGKSHGGKFIQLGVLAAGGQAVVLDRTKIEEYVRLADAMAELLPGVRAQVVRLDDPSVCVDPLQIFKGADRRQYTLGLFSVMLDIAAMDRQGRALGRAVDEVLKRRDPRMADVLTVLQRTADDEAAKADWRAAAAEVAEKMEALAENQLGRTIFGDGTPLDLARADYIVFAARHLVLPDEDELTIPHLARKLTPEKILGQGLIYLITAIAQNVAYADLNRMCLCVFDEVWALTASAEGKKLLLELLRNGRKHMAAVLLLSQDGKDVEALKDQIKYWFAFLHVTEDAARRTLDCMDLPDTAELVATLTSPEQMATGVCLVRDLDRRAGRMKFRPGPTRAFEEAMETNPERLAAIQARNCRSRPNGVPMESDRPHRLPPAPRRAPAGPRSAPVPVRPAAPAAASKPLVAAISTAGATVEDEDGYGYSHAVRPSKRRQVIG